MTLIRQTDRKGCGVACVAMVTGRSYDAIRRYALRRRLWRKDYGMNNLMLRTLLFGLGLPVVKQPVASAGQPDDFAIVKVKSKVRIKGQSFTRHWVVWHRDGRCFDPGSAKVWESLEAYLEWTGLATGRCYVVEGVRL